MGWRGTRGATRSPTKTGATKGLSAGRIGWQHAAHMNSMNRNIRWLAGMTPLLLTLMGTACEKAGDAGHGEGSSAGSAASTAAPPPASAAPVASAAAASASGAPDENIAPPTPVVSGDPDVPVNEGIVGTQPQPPDYTADTAPPAPVVEDKPPPP